MNKWEYHENFIRRREEGGARGRGMCGGMVLWGECVCDKNRGCVKLRGDI